MVDMAKRERESAEDRARMEHESAERAEEEVRMLREQLLEANRAKETYFSRACQLDELKVEMDRLRHVEADNGKLRDQLRDMEHRIASLNDKLSDMERANTSLIEQCKDNDQMMAKFADDIRQMDVEVDRKRREQDASNFENQQLKNDLTEMQHLQAKFDQMRITLDEETSRRSQAEAEAERLRNQLAQLSC